MGIIKWLISLFTSKRKEKTKFIWVGDGVAADGHKQVGRPVYIEGRRGVVVEGSPLTITVEWE